MSDPDIRIVHGTASPEETAAVVVALAAARAVGGAQTSPPTSASAWTAAARLEGVGARLVTSRADLTAP